MKRWTTAVLALLLLSGAAAYAQTRSTSRTLTVQDGRDVRLGIFASIRRDCTAGSPPSVRLVVPPNHGKVTVKNAKLRTTNFRQCLGVEAPAFVAVYRSVPDYSGYDLVVLEIKSGTKVQIQKIIIKVETRADSRRIDSKLFGSAFVSRYMSLEAS